LQDIYHQIEKIKILAKEIRKDVLKMSYEIMLALVIQTFQQEIIKAIQGIVEFNGVEGE
jgi:hypothetical protein